MKYPSILTLPVLASLVLIGCNDSQSSDETTSSGTSVSTSPQVEASAPTSETLQTCQTLGTYFAVSTNLHELEFTAEEKAAIVEGFRKGIEGGQSANFMQESVGVISAFLQERHQQKSAVDSERNKAAAAAFVEELKSSDGVSFTNSGLGYEILKAGEGEPASLRDSVSVNYRGTLIDGTVFDEAMDEESPVTFPLAGVIPGFSEGLQLVGKGGEIRLYIPSELGYGDNPRPGGPIEAGSLLIFDISVQDIQRAKLPTAEDLPVPPEPSE
ncbi:MAG: FKBP-type peptidyl-prolyl cis-trans isomerase [Puniceicoccaceae bacterium]